ncbi:DUF484 family protein [Acidithiobacillus thiooxidans]|uniref:DUF484 family protein n=1 Tax=Acidithiobacillus thiooxidans TaxID=930 RepID=UPI0002FF626F|nr:DUF484 family protein [Acidithiobacillus thiooxidans]
MATAPEHDAQAEQVRQYLLEHPQYLWDQEDLLLSLTLPHVGRGSASSLLERQPGFRDEIASAHALRLLGAPTMRAGCTSDLLRL